MGNLVLKRSHNKGITITTAGGERIHITVDMEKGASQVGLVVDAPRSVEVNRDEIQMIKDQEKASKMAHQSDGTMNTIAEASNNNRGRSRASIQYKSKRNRSFGMS